MIESEMKAAAGEAILRSLSVRELGHPEAKLKTQSLLSQDYVFLQMMATMANVKCRVARTGLICN